MLKCVLFDLDGTLLPIDTVKHIKEYFVEIRKYFETHGFAGDEFFAVFMSAVRSMTKSTGEDTIERVFWQEMENAIPGIKERLSPALDDFYKNHFPALSRNAYSDGAARELIELCHSQKLDCVIATSPFFPRVAIVERLSWCGLSPDDFVYMTGYEDSKYAKPNPKYFAEILDRLSLRADECIVIGNDARDDLAAESVGLSVFLIERDLLNIKGVDLSDKKVGSVEECKQFILEKLAKCK